MWDIHNTLQCIHKILLHAESINIQSIFLKKKKKINIQSKSYTSLVYCKARKKGKKKKKTTVFLLVNKKGGKDKRK